MNFGEGGRVRQSAFLLAKSFRKKGTLADMRRGATLCIPALPESQQHHTPTQQTELFKTDRGRGQMRRWWKELKALHDKVDRSGSRVSAQTGQGRLSLACRSGKWKGQEGRWGSGAPGREGRVQEAFFRSRHSGAKSRCASGHVFCFLPSRGWRATRQASTTRRPCLLSVRLR